MSKAVYLRLALGSMRRNYRITVPFLCGSTLMAAMVYTMGSLASNPDLLSTYGGMTLQGTLGFGTQVIEFFTLIFYFYLISVWNRSRQQENGLYTVLGMEKGHLIRILAYQMIAALLLCLPAGILLGLLLEKLFSLLILRLFALPPLMGFYFSIKAAGETAIWTLGCYGLMFVWTAVLLSLKNPLNQMKSNSAGEKKIRNRWILAALGIVLLGSGYWLAQTVQDPLEAMAFFFVAVILVIAGTYLLFLYGTGALLSLMQKNKRYYYRTSHFISVSTMRYRMSRTAASMASIAILSTMILVTLSTTITLFAGVSQYLDVIYTGQVRLVQMGTESIPDPETLANAIDQAGDEVGFDPENITVFRMAFARFEEEKSTQPVDAMVIDVNDLNRLAGQNIVLEKGQLLSFDPTHPAGESLAAITEGGPEETYEIIQTAELPRQIALPYASMSPSEVFAADFEKNGQIASRYVAQFDCGSGALFDPQDTKFPAERSQIFYENLARQDISTDNALLGTRAGDEAELKEMYGAMLFLGLYISALFILAVILIMYYKQMSEGIEDQKRFEILQKIGLEPSQIRKIINDQVLLLFFLPLATALVHIAFAYPMISKILRLLSITNASAFLFILLACFAIFALIYILIYRLTARTYYRLTCSK